MDVGAQSFFQKGVINALFIKNGVDDQAVERSTLHAPSD
jgi:hypothetical protein